MASGYYCAHTHRGYLKTIGPEPAVLVCLECGARLDDADVVEQLVDEVVREAHQMYDYERTGRYPDAAHDDAH